MARAEERLHISMQYQTVYSLVSFSVSITPRCRTEKKPQAIRYNGSPEMMTSAGPRRIGRGRCCVTFPEKPQTRTHPDRALKTDRRNTCSFTREAVEVPCVWWGGADPWVLDTTDLANRISSALTGGSVSLPN